MRRFALVPGLAGLLTLLATAAGAGTVLTAGEYAPRGSGVFDHPALFATDTRSGASAILSDLRNPAQGPLGTRAVDVAVTGRGRILLLDHDGSVPGTAGTVFVVDARGRRTVLSDLGDPSQGPTGVSPEEIAVARSGAIYVVDSDAGPRNDGAVFAIDPRDGGRRTVSAFGDAAQGPALSADPYAIAVQRDGTLLVLDHVALYAIDPRDGRRVVVSTFDDAAQGPRLVRPESVVATPEGDVLLADPEVLPRTELGGGERSGAVLRVDLATGVRSVVSTSADAAEGPLLYGPWALATTRQGALYAWSATPDDRSGIFAIDVASGRRRFIGAIASARAGWRGGGLGIAYHPARLVRCAPFACRLPLPRREVLS